MNETTMVLTFFGVLGLCFACFVFGRINKGAEVSDDLAELKRWRVHTQQYRQWLATEQKGYFALVLDNLSAEAQGRERDICWPPGTHGPWDIAGLREVLRQRSREGYVPAPTDWPTIPVVTD